MLRWLLDTFSGQGHPNKTPHRSRFSGIKPPSLKLLQISATKARESQKNHNNRSTTDEPVTSTAANSNGSETLFEVGEISLKGNFVVWIVFNILDIPLCTNTQILSPRFRWKGKELQFSIWRNLATSNSLDSWRFGIYYYNHTDKYSSIRVRSGILDEYGERIHNFDTMAFDDCKRFMVRRLNLRTDEEVRSTIPRGHLRIFCGLRKPPNVKASPLTNLSSEDSNSDFHIKGNGVKRISKELEYRNSKKRQLLTGSTENAPKPAINLLSDEKANCLVKPNATSSPPPDEAITKPDENSPGRSQHDIIKEKEDIRNQVKIQSPFARGFSTVFSKAHRSNFRQPRLVKQAVATPDSERKESYSNSQESSYGKKPGFFNLSGTSNTCEYKNDTNECRSCSQRNSRRKSEDAEFTRLKKLCNLNFNFKELYESGEHSDLTIKVNGHDFRVHRLILMNRCQVFSHIYFHDMWNSNTISIDDMDPEIFHDFLMFLYTCKVENISLRNVQGLYYAAHKYLLPLLKNECIEYMQNILVYRSDLQYREFQYREFLRKKR